MDWLKVISNYALLTIGLLVFLAIWVLSILAASAGLNRRGLPRQERLFWLALVIVLPLIGYTLYLLSGMARWIVNAEPGPDTPSRRDLTGIRTPSGLAPPEVNPGPSTVAAMDAASPAPSYAPPVSPPPAPSYASPAPPPASPARCYLVAVDGPASGTRFVLNSLPVRLGRGDDADLRLDADQHISRRHAELFRQGPDICIRDLGSLHGTSVNGAIVSSRSLQSGDRITVGDTVLQFLCQ